MIDWQKLIWRLQAVAHNKQYGGCNGPAIVHVVLILNDNGELVGWLKPERRPLEPKSLDLDILPVEKVS